MTLDYQQHIRNELTKVLARLGVTGHDPLEKTDASIEAMGKKEIELIHIQHPDYPARGEFHIYQYGGLVYWIRDERAEQCEIERRAK